MPFSPRNKRLTLIAVAVVAIALSGVGGSALIDGVARDGVSVSSLLAPTEQDARQKLAHWHERAQDGDDEVPVTGQDFVPGQIVVRFLPHVSRSARGQIRQENGATLIRRLQHTHAELWRLADRKDVGVTRERLEKDPRVAYAEPNFILQANETPDDPGFDLQWGLLNDGQTVNNRSGSAGADIDAAQAWDETTGTDAVTVAVIDSGIAYDHPDLASNAWANPGESGAAATNGQDDDGNGYVDDERGWDWLEDDNDPRDSHGHGTHVAGIAGARGGDSYGIAGVSWRARLMALRVLDPSGIGTSADAASAIDYATSKGARIVNMSLGGDRFSQVLLDSIARASDSLFVVAAGNSGLDVESSPRYPCSYPAVNIVCVASTGQSDELSSFSNYGRTSVDLAAPGSNIVSAQPSIRALFSDDFSSDLAGRWATGGAGVQWGRDSDSTGTYLADSPAAAYDNSTDSWATLSQAVDLAGYSGCRLAYRLRLDTEAGQDGLYVEASTDGSSWTRLAAWSGTSNGAWQSLSDDLSEFDGGSVLVRFRFKSDGATNAAGADVDDVTIRCFADSYSGNEFAYKSGTSMATPHVAGAAALLWSLDASAGVADIKNALMEGTERVSSLETKTVTGGRLNAYRSIALLTGIAVEESPAPEGSASSPAEEDDGSSGGGGGGGGGSDDDGPSPEPSPSGEASEPSPTPAESPEEDRTARAMRMRQITLVLREHLVSRGRLTAEDGERGCVGRMRVKIVRNGRVVATAKTRATGRFRVALPDRAGRYVAVALASEDQGCARARSPRRTHRH